MTFDVSEALVHGLDLGEMIHGLHDGILELGGSNEMHLQLSWRLVI